MSALARKQAPSCISHPQGAAILLFREDYLAICEHSKPAAAILAILEYLTNCALADNKSAWIAISQKAICEKSFDLFNRKTINVALQKLRDWGFLLTRLSNENSFNRVQEHRLNVPAIQQSLNAFKPQRRNEEFYSIDCVPQHNALCNAHAQIPDIDSPYIESNTHTSGVPEVCAADAAQPDDTTKQDMVSDGNATRAKIAQAEAGNAVSDPDKPAIKERIEDPHTPSSAAPLSPADHVAESGEMVAIPEGYEGWCVANDNEQQHLYKVGGERPLCGCSAKYPRPASLPEEKRRKVCERCTAVLDKPLPHIASLRAWFDVFSDIKPKDVNPYAPELCRHGKNQAKAIADGKLTADEIAAAARLARAWYDNLVVPSPLLVEWRIPGVIDMQRTFLRAHREGFTPDDVRTTMDDLKADTFWRDKMISYATCIRRLPMSKLKARATAPVVVETQPPDSLIREAQEWADNLPTPLPPGVDVLNEYMGALYAGKVKLLGKAKQS